LIGEEPLGIDLLSLLASAALHPQVMSAVRRLSSWSSATGVEAVFVRHVLDPFHEHLDETARLLAASHPVARTGLVLGGPSAGPDHPVFLALHEVALAWLLRGVAHAAAHSGWLQLERTAERDARWLDGDALETLRSVLEAHPEGARVRLVSTGGVEVRRMFRASVHQSGTAGTTTLVASLDGTEPPPPLRLQQALLLASLADTPLLLEGLCLPVGDDARTVADSLVDRFVPLDRARSPHVFLADPTADSRVRPIAQLGERLRFESVAVPFPSRARRRRAWGGLLRRIPTATLDRLAAFPLGVDEIERLASTGRPTRAAGDPLEALVRRCREAVSHRVGELAQRVETTLRWDDVVLPDDVRRVADEMIAFAANRDTVFQAWGFRAKFSYGTGLSALFSGPPGTGKTMLAGLVARELGLDLYQIDLSRIVSKYIGETEERLARLFEEAERGGVALLFDEADALFARRTNVKSSVDRYANLEVNFLLQRVEAFDGVVILTTNFAQSIDEAFLRRIRFHAKFPMPNRSERERLWAAMLPASAPVEDGLPLGALAQAYEMSGAEIKNAVLRAAFLAAEEGAPLNLRALDRAAAAECRDKGRLVRHTAMDFLNRP